MGARGRLLCDQTNKNYRDLITTAAEEIYSFEVAKNLSVKKEKANIAFIFNQTRLSGR